MQFFQYIMDFRRDNSLKISDLFKNGGLDETKKQPAQMV